MTLTNLLQKQGALTRSEAECVLEMWRGGFREPWHGSEAVVHYGGPAVLLRDAIRRRHLLRRYEVRS